MVLSVTGLTGNGLRDWLIQRATAVWLLFYTAFLISFFARHTPLDFSAWQALFDCTAMKVATVITVVTIMAHAWIGLWAVITDYIKCVCLRVTAYGILAFALLGGLVWSLAILWGK